MHSFRHFPRRASARRGISRLGAIGAVFASATFALAASVAGAQEPAGVIEGSVIGARDRAPLGDVVVRAAGTSRGALTDAQGRYRIAGVPAGMYDVIAQRVGLVPDTQRVQVDAGAVARVDFELHDAAAIITPVVVSATREAQRRSESSATIEVLDGGEVRRTRASHPSGIMNRVPGVHVSELSGEGHSMAIRQPITTKPMYLFLEDGVPTRATGFFNHNALYEVNIPQAGGIEVLKGPGTAMYGSDAIGGVVNVLTRPAPVVPELELTLEGGGHGYGRVLASGGMMAGGHGLRADLNITRSDNWKEAAPFERQSGTIRWDVYDARGWAVRTVLTASNIDQHDVPPIDSAQFATTPSLNRAPIAYREVQAVRLSSAFEREHGASSWSITPFARWNVLNVLPTWQLSYDPQTWEQSNASVGALVKYRRDFERLDARVIVGADADWSPGRFVAREAITTPVGEDRIHESYTTGETHYDYDVTYRALSPYVHAEISPLPRIRFDAGLRYDWAGYDYASHLPPLATGPHRRPADLTVSYGHLSPKLGVTADITSWLDAFGSYRHGFRAPSQGQLFQQNSAANTVGLDPVTVDSWEAGLRGEAFGRVVYQLSAYDMRIRDDILTFITPENTREAVNAGETRHRGIEGGLGVVIVSGVRVDASYAASRQTYERWTPRAGVDYSGNRMELAPSTLANVLVTYSPSLLGGGRLAAEWSHTGRYAMDPANARVHEGHDLLTLHANAFVRPDVELFVRVVNATDERYAEVATYDAFQGKQFTPGAPRTVFAGLRYEWRK